MTQSRYQTICRIRNATRKTLYHATKTEKIEKLLEHTPEKILQSRNAIADMDEIVSRTHDAVKRIREEYGLVYRDLCALERAYNAWSNPAQSRTDNIPPTDPGCGDWSDYS